MFFEIAQFLKFFIVSPITWMLTTLILGLVLKRKILTRLFLSLSVVLFVAFTNTWIVDHVMILMVKNHSTPVVTQKHYKVAIVMGGFSSINSETGKLTYIYDRADRLWEAVRLYREGMIDNILITGDPSTALDDNGNTTAPQFLQYMSGFGVPASVFILEQKALNTLQNALFTVDILQRENISSDSCLLITSAIHMRRALYVFEKHSISLDYIPVSVPQNTVSFNHRSFYPRWETAVKWEQIFNELIGNVVYQLK